MTADGGAKIETPEGAGAPQAPRLDPVEAPGELVGHLRWRNPEATAAAGRGLTKLPAEMAREVLDGFFEGLLEEAVGGKVDVERFVRLVDPAAPLDIVLLLDMASGPVPEPLFALSVGLRNLDDALASSNGKPTPLASGTWQIGSPDDGGDPCVVTVAAGRAPARLVCGESLEALEKVAPYAARNVATFPDPPQDVRFDLNLRPLFDKYGAKWARQVQALPILAENEKIGNALFDEALVEAAEAIADEAGALIADFDGVRIDAGVTAQKGVDIALELRFVGSQSWLAQGVALAAKNRGPAPDLFWNLPADHAVVAYGHTGDGSHTAPLLKTARAMAEGLMQEEQIGTGGDRAALVKLLRAPWGDNVGFVSANGNFDAPPPPQGAAPDPSALFEAAVGWYLMGFEEKPAALAAYLDEMVRTYNRPTLQSLLKKELGPAARSLPKIRSVRPPPGFAKAVRFEALVYDDPTGGPPPPIAPGGPPPPPAPKTKPTKVTLELLLMADGGRTWLGFASKQKDLVALMKGLKGAPGADSVAKVAPLQRFRTERHDGVSVTTLGGVLDGLSPVFDVLMALAGPGPTMQQLVASMPNQGTSPMITTVDSTGGTAPTTRAALNVPAGTLEDVARLVEESMKLMNGFGGGPGLAPPVAPPPPMAPPPRGP